MEEGGRRRSGCGYECRKVSLEGGSVTLQGEERGEGMDGRRTRIPRIDAHCQNINLNVAIWWVGIISICLNDLSHNSVIGWLL